MHWTDTLSRTTPWLKFRQWDKLLVTLLIGIPTRTPSLHRLSLCWMMTTISLINWFHQITIVRWVVRDTSLQREGLSNRIYSCNKMAITKYWWRVMSNQVKVWFSVRTYLKVQEGLKPKQIHPQLHQVKTWLRKVSWDLLSRRCSNN